MADDQAVRRGEREVRRDNPQSERLCYFLRHHPSKDHKYAAKGQPGGWFKYTDVLPWFRNFDEQQLDALVASSRSFIPPHAHRFESRTVTGVKWIRARYGHSFDTSFSDIELESEAGDIPTLTDLLLKQVVADLPSYLPQLSTLQDGSLLSALFVAYKRMTGGKMSNKVIKSFLLPQVPSLDFKNILLEESIIRLLPKSCPQLCSLFLEGCFTCMTDTNLQYLLKRCTELRQLEISGCKYLTLPGLQNLIKLGAKLNFLSLRWIKPVTPKFVEQLCTALPELEHLNITGCPCIHPNDVIDLINTFPNIYIQYDTVDDVTDGLLAEGDAVDEEAEDHQAVDWEAEVAQIADEV